MSFQKTVLPLLALGGLLSGCASAVPPSFTSEDVQDAIAEFNRIDALEASSATQVSSRTGSANYVGVAGGDFGPGSDLEGGMIGDLKMTVNFDDSTITDAVFDNINIIEDEVPTQLLTGEMTGDGGFSGNAVNLSVSGSLTGVEDGFEGTSSGTLFMTGEFRNDNGVADAILGDLSGSVDGDYYGDVTGGFAVAEE